MSPWKGFRERIPKLIPSPPPALLHAFELAFAAIFLIIGVQLIASGHQVSVSEHQYLPTPIVVVWEICLLAGGPLMMLGLLWPRSETMARGIETAGLSLGAAAWTSYAIVILDVTRGRFLASVFQAIVICLACLIRAWALYRVEKAITVAVKAEKKREEGDD